MTQWAVAIAVLLALVTALATGPILRRLPEPTDDPDIAAKLPYAQLATPHFALVVGVCSLAAASIAVILTAPTGWIAWSALAGPGALAAAIDARTTWMPKVLLHGVGAVAAFGILTWAISSGDTAVVLRALSGAALTGGFFYLFWRLTGGIGFSDVRLMTSVGAVSAATSVDTALAAVLTGALLGAGWGLARQLRGRRGPFAYGPGLWAGAFAGLALVQTPVPWR